MTTSPNSLSFQGQRCTVQVQCYHNPDNIALQLWCSDGPMATATVNTPLKLNEGIVCIKDWSENEGILEALIEAGIVSEPLGVYRFSYCEGSLCALQIQY